MLANVRPVLRESAKRRLRLKDLTPGSRVLARSCLIAISVTAGIVLLTPFSQEMPGGVILIPWAYDPEINRLDLVAAMVGLAVAFATLGVAAVTPGWRWRRTTLLLLAMGGALIIPAGINLQDAYVVPVRAALGGAYAAVVGLAILGLLGPNLPRMVFGALAAAPVALSLVALLGSRLGPIPDLAEQVVAADIVLGISSLDGIFVVLAMWAAIEYGRAIAGVARATTSLPFAGRLLVGLTAAKLAMILITSAGWMPELLRPAETPWQQLMSDSWLSMALAAVYVLGIGGWLLARRRLELKGEEGIVAATIIGLPLVASLFLGVVVLPALNSIAQLPGVSLDLETLGSLSSAIASTIGVLLALGPILAVLLALAVGIAIVVSRRRLLWGLAAFLLAFAAWTGIPALAIALSELAAVPAFDPGGGAFGFVHPVTLDLAMTVLVVILLVAWWRGLQRSLPPASLLILFAVTTLIAYGQVVLAGILATIVFWLSLAFPVVARFGFSAGSLNAKSPDREARVLAAVGFASLTLAFTIPMLAFGSIGPESSGKSPFFQALLLVPFSMVMVVAAISTDGPVAQPRAVS